MAADNNENQAKDNKNHATAAKLPSGNTVQMWNELENGIYYATNPDTGDAEPITLTGYNPSDLYNNIANKVPSDNTYFKDVYDAVESEWYFDKIFQNNYLSSTLYFNQVSSGQTEGSGFIAVEKCIVRPFSFSVDNRFDQTGTSIFSKIQTSLFRNIRELANFDSNPFSLGLSGQSKMLTKYITSFLEGRKQEYGTEVATNDFWGGIATNALKVLEATNKTLNYLNSVQFESDAGFARTFMATSVSSPVHATFFFLQDSADDTNTNRKRAFNLLKYILPYQSMYYTWEQMFSTENQEGKGIIDAIKTGINDTVEKLGLKTAKETITELAGNIFNGGVIATRAPGGYVGGRNQIALKSASKGIPDQRTFMISTPWGMRINLVPSNINITESQSKVVINGGKIVPMYIQIDIDFVPSRKLLSMDVANHVLGSYNLKQILNHVGVESIKPQGKDEEPADTSTTSSGGGGAAS